MIRSGSYYRRAEATHPLTLNRPGGNSRQKRSLNCPQGTSNSNLAEKLVFQLKAASFRELPGFASQQGTVLLLWQQTPKDWEPCIPPTAPPRVGHYSFLSSGEDS